MVIRKAGIALLVMALTVTAACGGGGTFGDGELGRSLTTPAPATQRGGTLTGDWTGRPRCDGGDQVESVCRVGPSGNPIHEYDTKDGASSEELKQVGQRIRFISPEGGVSIMVVDALSVNGKCITYTLRINHEKTSGGTLSQRRGGLTVDAVAQGKHLAFSFTLKESSTISQPGFVLPPSESTTACRGTLTRA